MADASVLGIYPPSTVRIDLDGWVHDWPWEAVRVLGDRVEIVVASVKRLPDIVHQDVCSRYEGRSQVALYYPYEHAQACCVAHELERFYPPIAHPRSWAFHGRETFFVTAGPAQPPSHQ